MIEDPSETNKPTNSLGDWYANILYRNAQY